MAIAGGSWFVNELRPVGSDKTLRRFVITFGENASQIGQNLQKEHFIKDAISFRIYTQVTQTAKDIQAGSYELPSNLWTYQIVDKLLQGPTEVWVTIPEGLRHEEIGEKFIGAFSLAGKAAEDFRSDFLQLTKDKEGYLFPDTYLFAKDSTAALVVKTMRATYDAKVTFGASYTDLILASIIERETRTDEERPIVAGILVKRLSAGWPLQTDATIQYALGDWKPITADDLGINSVYNTYKNLGLPPTPIANPGLSAIKAAVNPTSSNYWYYVHDSSGQIHYAATIEEQNDNIAKYLQ